MLKLERFVRNLPDEQILKLQTLGLIEEQAEAK